MAGGFEIAEAYASITAEVDENQVKGSVSKLPSILGPALAVVGAAIGAVITAAIAEGMAQEANADLVAASLGLTPAESDRLGGIAGDVYANAFGDSVAEVQDVAGAIWRQVGDIGDEQIQMLTEDALTMADVWGVDVQQVIAAASQLVDTGLAPSFESAFDIVAAGFRDSTAPADEFLASIQEYAPAFSALGLTAEDMYQLISSGAVTSTIEVDKAGDAFKEMGIKIGEGNVETHAALESMGFDIDAVNAAYAEGGPAAQAMTEEIVSALGDIEDPQARYQAGVALMGTPFEDLGDQAIPILSSIVGGVEDIGDVTGDTAATAYDNVQTGFTESWREVKQMIVDEVWPRVQPVLSALLDWVQEKLPVGIDMLKEAWENIQPPLETVIDIIQAVFGWLQDNWELVKNFAIALGILAGAVGAVNIVLGIMNAILAINPFVAITIAVIAIATLIYTYWDEIVEFFGGIWDWIKDTAGGVWDFIKGVFEAGMDFIKDLFFKFTPLGFLIANFDKIKDAVTRVWTWIKEKFQAVVDFVTDLFKRFTPLGFIISNFDKIKEIAAGAGQWIKDKFDGVVTFFTKLPERIGNALSGMWDGIKTAFKSAVNWIIEKWNDLSLGIGPFTVPGWIPGLGGKVIDIKLNTPNIPLLGDGGIVSSPMLAGIGERGPEAVLPLTDDVFDRIGMAIARHMPTGVNQSFTLSEARLNDPAFIEWQRRAQWQAKTSGV